MINQTIPLEFSPFFWDVQVNELELDQYKQFIIERLLNEGDHHTLKWLLQTYSLDDIETVIRSSRNLTRKTARYWQAFFNLEEEHMRCFGMSSTNLDKLF